MSFAKPMLAGNWKMHQSPREAEAFFSDFLARVPEGSGRSIVFFPPAVSLPAAAAAVAGRADVSVGIQNVYWEERGAFTGEIAPGMAAEAGAELALVGHSERRQLFGETREETARKTRAVLSAGMVPLLCVGETLEEREAGRAGEVVEEQLGSVYDGLGPQDAGRVIVAYEPVWAIGTGRTASPRDAEEMHARIRALLRGRLGEEEAAAVPILYGGSVKPDNAAQLLAAAEVDGVLVGGASLDAAGFAAICRATG